MRNHGYFTNVSFIPNPRWFFQVSIVFMHESGQKSSGKVRRRGIVLDSHLYYLGQNYAFLFLCNL
jgi:hypothetical protein